MVRISTFLIPCAAIALSACQGERTAEAETPVAEAEVSTELPESVVSDRALEATANAAAQVASSPPPVVIPVPVGNGATAQPSTGNMQVEGAPGAAPATANGQ